MVNWSGVVIPIVVAVLALLGTLAVALVNNYVQTMNKPKVNVIIEPNGTKAFIHLFNEGLAPATNLSLIIEAFKDFTLVTKIFGAADVIAPQLPKIDQTLSLVMPRNVTTPRSYLELRIPKLPQGEGSSTEIEIANGTLNNTHSDYKSVAIFDQGSSIGRPPPSHSELLDRQFGFFGGYYYFIYYYLLAASYALYFLFLWLRRWKNKVQFRKFISYIRHLLLDIHSDFEENQNKQENIHRFIETWKNKSIGRYTIKIVNFLDMKDYFIIENLYRKLLKNQAYIESHPNQVVYNDFLKLIEDALKFINWKKYLP